MQPERILSKTPDGARAAAERGRRCTFRSLRLSRRCGFCLPLLAALGLGLVVGAQAAPFPGRLCVDAARAAAEGHDIPFDVMLALALTESGTRRDGRETPWPWAVNDAGVGHWFESREAVLRHARAKRDLGARNFDIGCFQLNFHWHGAAFHSLEAMVDPKANADYAAAYLRSHFDATGDWVQAAGRYHSRTETLALAYSERFSAQRRGLQDRPAPDRLAEAALPGGLAALAAGGARPPGSLVSLAETGRPAFAPVRSLSQ